MTKKTVFRKLDKELQGKRIRLLQMNDEPNPVPAGTESTIFNVANAGTIHVKWDDGSLLGVIIWTSILFYNQLTFFFIFTN